MRIESLEVVGTAIMDNGERAVFRIYGSGAAHTDGGREAAGLVVDLRDALAQVVYDHGNPVCEGGFCDEYAEDGDTLCTDCRVAENEAAAAAERRAGA